MADVVIRCDAVCKKCGHVMKNVPNDYADYCYDCKED